MRVLEVFVVNVTVFLNATPKNKNVPIWELPYKIFNKIMVLYQSSCSKNILA